MPLLRCRARQTEVKEKLRKKGQRSSESILEGLPCLVGGAATCLGTALRAQRLRASIAGRMVREVAEQSPWVDLRC